MSIEKFRAAMIALDIPAPFDIQADGTIHRFYIEGDRRGSKNGWYLFFGNFISFGAFGSWKTGLSKIWCSQKSQKMSPLEKEFFEQSVIAAKQQFKRQREQIQNLAAIKAEHVYSNSSAINPYHPYLLKKHIRAFCARQEHNNIVLPIVNFEGEIHSLQYIASNGAKWFLKNGSIKEHFIPVQRHTNNFQYILCEGFATAATLAEFYPECNVIAACNAGNLKSVAVGLRKHFPHSDILICADDDRLSPTNTGIIKGREAAIAAQASFTSPEWPKGAPQELSDFNDLACWKRLQQETIV